MAAIVFATLALSTLCHINAQKNGFSVELIHRDSVKSPFYNPSETPSDRVTNALRRSFNRVHLFMPNSAAKPTPKAEIIVDSGAYLMKMSLGTPPFETVAIADTGSDLIWTQCKPCTRCYKQEAPLFDPRNSFTYRKISCGASQCQNLEGSSCSTHNSCQYYVRFGDGTYSRGVLGSDTLTLDSTTDQPVVFPKTVIGCGRDNNGTLGVKSSGIIGLGRGEVSLISQLGASIAGKFSYCLLPHTEIGNSSKMNFGSNAIVSGPGVVSTPMANSSPNDTYYFLTLEAISVGSERIKFSDSPSGSRNGNIIIDSGTTLTLLPPEFYTKLVSAMSSQINATRLKTPKGFDFLCYDARKVIEIPDVTVHFTDADVKLTPLNTFFMISDTVRCFGFYSVGDLTVYGNIAQINFLIGYDIEKLTVSFKPTDCSKN